MRGRLLSGILTLVLLILIFLNPTSAWRIQSLLLNKSVPSAAPENSLELQNEALQAELAKYKDVQNGLLVWSPDYITAFIYSRYPFNLKSELIAGAGKNQGVREGQTVVIPASLASSSTSRSGLVSPPKNFVLIGKVVKVNDDTAEVRTVFDSRFQSAVRIGNSGTDAFLTGGTEPRLTLIPKDALLKNGDAVYAAAPDYPYGLALGKIDSINLSKDQFFKEGILVVGYDLNSLRAILITK